MTKQLGLFEDFEPPEEKSKNHKLEIDCNFWENHLSPKSFGSFIGQDEDTICNKIDKGMIKAINLNPGGVKARYAIPKDELKKFEKPEYQGVYKHLKDDLK